jgi:hypothetical protein
MNAVNEYASGKSANNQRFGCWQKRKDRVCCLVLLPMSMMPEPYPHRGQEKAGGSQRGGEGVYTQPHKTNLQDNIYS